MLGAEINFFDGHKLNHQIIVTSFFIFINPLHKLCTDCFTDPSYLLWS